MPTFAPSLPTILRVLLMGFVLVVANGMRAQNSQGGFTATLSSEQKNTSGLSTLTPEERDALDQLVKIEVAQARNEGATEWEGTLATRHTDAELHQAGLDRLTPEQLKKLNALIASAVAASPKPRDRPRLKDSDVFAQSKPQVHGEISLTYGRTSGGGEIRGGSMWVDYYDPKSGISLGVGISRFSGTGLWGLYPYPSYYDFGPGYGYDDGFGYYDASFRQAGRMGILDDDSRPYSRWDDRRGAPWASVYFRDFRRN